jgi:hypothetical protein
VRRLLAPILLLLITTLVLFPAFSGIGSHVIGDGGDNYQFLGFQSLGHRLWSEGKFPFGWTDYWRYPHGVQFQSATDSTLLVLAGLVLYPLLHDPVVVYNAAVIALLLANASLSYLAFRTWFARPQALLGAIVYGLSFYSLGKLGGHVNLITTAGFALFAAAVLRLQDAKRPRAAWVQLVLACLTVAFASLQYPLILVGALPFAAGLTLVFFPDTARALVQTLRRQWLAFALSAAALAAAFGLFHGRKLLDLARGEVQLPPETIITVPAVNFVSANRYLPVAASVLSNSTRPWIEYAVFFGYVEIALAGLALVVLPRSRLKWYLAAATALFLVLSLGRWPYPYLFRVLPYRGIIEPARFCTIAYLAATILILLLLERIEKKWALAAIGVLLVAERLPRNFHLSPPHRDPELVAAVRSRPTRAVLDLPAYTSWWNGQRYDLYSVHYDRPIVMGYIHWSGDGPASSRLVRELAPFGCHVNPQEAPHETDAERLRQKAAQILGVMREHGIRTVVLHKDLFRSDPECGTARLYIDALLEKTEQWEVVLDTPAKRVLWRRND